MCSFSSLNMRKHENKGLNFGIKSRSVLTLFPEIEGEARLCEHHRGLSVLRSPSFQSSMN